MPDIPLPLDEEIDSLLDRLVALPEEALLEEPPAELVTGDNPIRERRLFGMARGYLRTKDELEALKEQQAVVLNEYMLARQRLEARMERAKLALEVMAPHHIPAKKKSATLPGLARLQFKQGGGTWVLPTSLGGQQEIIERVPEEERKAVTRLALDPIKFREWADAYYAELVAARDVTFQNAVAQAKADGLSEDDPTYPQLRDFPLMLPAQRTPEGDSFSIVDVRAGHDEPDEPPMPSEPPVEEEDAPTAAELEEALPAADVPDEANIPL